MSQAATPLLLSHRLPSSPPTTQQAFDALDGTLRFINDEDLRNLLLWHFVNHRVENGPSTHVQLPIHATLQETFDAYRVVYQYIATQTDALNALGLGIEQAHSNDKLLFLMNAHVLSRCDASEFLLPLARPTVYDTSWFGWVTLSGRDIKDAFDGAFRLITNTELRSRVVEILLPGSSPLVCASFLRTVPTEQVLYRKET